MVDTIYFSGVSEFIYKYCDIHHLTFTRKTNMWKDLWSKVKNGYPYQKEGYFMLILSILQYQIIAVKSGIFGQQQHSYILLCLFLY